MSVLTPEEQVGFHRQKGWYRVAGGGFFVLVGLGYCFLFGPWMRDAEPGESVNALMYAYYELFGITAGTLVISGFGLLVSLMSLPHFAKAREIKKSIRQ